MKTAEELRSEIISRASENDDFRASLLQDPKAAIEKEFAFSIPDDWSVEVHEETGRSAHLVLPPSGRLGEAELASVAGGWNLWDDLTD